MVDKSFLKKCLVFSLMGSLLVAGSITALIYIKGDNKNPVFHYESLIKTKLQYSYEPEVSELYGTLKELVFPGRPNYDSIEDGDEKEEGWYLQLSDKIDVLVGNSEESKAFHNTDEKDVDLIQIAIHWGAPTIQKEKHKFKVGARVRIKGTLFSRRFGHHHTPVLIFTDDVKVE